MKLLALLALVASLLTAGAAEAQYPDKPVRIIVPFIAGSAPDVAARQVAQRLTASLGQQFVVDNKPGVAGNIGAEVAARAAPDGYSLMLMTSSHVLSPLLYAKVNYDPIKDFVPVTMITRIPSLMVVPPSSPARSVMEFVALAKSMPGKLSYGSGGAGSLAHLSAEAFRLAAGIDYLHVPYKGAPDIVLALLSKQIDVGFPTMPTAFRPAQQGTLRALAVTSAKRTKARPKVPTLLEAMPDGFADRHAPLRRAGRGIEGPGVPQRAGQRRIGSRVQQPGRVCRLAERRDGEVAGPDYARGRKARLASSALAWFMFLSPARGRG
ncbi:Tripartite-type tricarboxylate transporter, receptor component TctC [Rhodospirillales bacterium URHD0017]|nr:Tripartite-type tricarboxylate transporter, receptor component TctC [Rhodospirillales bacterium URHD0017]